MIAADRDGAEAAGRVAAPVGVVLAGGDSRRMGCDKATLEVGGTTLAARAVAKLAPLCDEVLVADGGRGTVPGFASISDGDGTGPAAGILAAAAARPGRALLVLACDLPAVPSALFAALAGEVAADWAVPRWSGGLEPLCACYAGVCLEALAARVGAGRMDLHSLVERTDLAVVVYEGPRLLAFGEPAAMFRNLNRPEDLGEAAIEP